MQLYDRDPVSSSIRGYGEGKQSFNSSEHASGMAFIDNNNWDVRKSLYLELVDGLVKARKRHT